MSWSRYRPSSFSPWTIEKVVHLHRRAGFGATWTEVQADLATGPDATVSRLLETRADAGSASAFSRTSMNIGQAAAGSNNPARLRAWWLHRMLVSPDVLGERLTLMWHNHFATSNRKVSNLVMMLRQNELLREHAFGEFEELLLAVMKDPALLNWLDADANRKGAPNENLARELFELFALGIDNYDESDVQAAAVALTGWSTQGNEFVFRKSRHDDRPVTLFGIESKLDGETLLERTLAQPAVPRRLAWRLCKTFFAEPLVTPKLIHGLAERLADTHLNIKDALETILRSEVFFSSANMRSRVSGPAEFVVTPIRSLELMDPPPQTMKLGEWVARMGQVLFYPPNVGGWAEGRSWLGTRSLIARANYCESIVKGSLWRRQTPDDIEVQLSQLLTRYGIKLEPDSALRWFSELLLGRNDAAQSRLLQTRVVEAKEGGLVCACLRAVLASPEFHLA